MTRLASSLTASTARPVVLRRRPDLVVSVQRYEGRTFYLIKDPVALRYYRFQEEEYKILDLLNGRRSLKEIQQAFEGAFIPQKITPEELQRFIGRLHETGLVLSDAPGQGDKLLARARKQRQRQIWSVITNILYIKLPAFDPERILQWLYPHVRWVFKPLGVLLAVLFVLSALGLVLVNFDAFSGQPELQSFHAFFNTRRLGISSRSLIT